VRRAKGSMLFFLRLALVLFIAFAPHTSPRASAQTLRADAAETPASRPESYQLADHVALSTPALPQVTNQYELQLLRNQRPRLGWPIAVTAAGGAFVIVNGALIGVMYAFYGAFGTEDGERIRVGDVTPFLIGAGIGAAVAGVGVGWLVHRLHERRPFNQRMRELQTASVPGALVSW
jgi:hypothetical protein